MARKQIGCWSHPRHFNLIVVLSLAVAGVCLCCFLPEFVFGKKIRRPVPVAGEPVAPTEEEIDKELDSMDSQFPGSAVLEVDPDVVAQLRRADQHLRDGRVDVAVLLWQDILDQNSVSLLTKNTDPWYFESSDGVWCQTFRSVREEVELVLAKLSDQDRNEYLFVVDGPARTLLAEAFGEDQEAKLEAIVRRYYYSSVGEKAAYRLGCLLLDQQEFNGAGRIFQKILKGHPNSRVSKSDILLRIAVCNAALGGDKKSARKDVLAAEKLDDGSVSSKLYKLVNQFIDTGANSINTQLTNGSNNWLTRGGNFARNAMMPSPPADMLNATLTERWRKDFSLKKGSTTTNKTSSTKPSINNQNQLLFRQGIAINSRVYRPTSSVVATFSDRNSLVNKWKGRTSGNTPSGKSWFPIDQLIFYYEPNPTKSQEEDAKIPGNRRLLFRGFNDYQNLDLKNPAEETDKSPPEGSSPDPMVDANKFNRQQQRLQGNSQNQVPYSYQERMLFGDQAIRSVSVSDGVAYFIIGLPESRKVYNNRSTQQTGARNDNQLFAIDVRTSKMMWEWPQKGWTGGFKKSNQNRTGGPNANGPGAKEEGAEEEDDLEDENEDLFPYDFRFLNTPIKHGNLLIAPVLANNRLWLYAIKADRILTEKAGRHRLVWRTDLCDRPKSFDPDKAVATCLDGGDIYISTGFGTVFSIEANSGSVRWATRYRRTGFQPKQITTNRYGQPAFNHPLNGAGENYIATRGKYACMMAVDSEKLLFFDRQTGYFEFPSTRKIDHDEYWLGIYNDVLYTASSTKLHATICALQNQGKSYFDKKKGEEEGFDFSQGNTLRSHGRGFLTPEGVYLPIEKSIHLLSLEKNPAKRSLKQPYVRYSGNNDDPVGNIYSDGQTIYVSGGGRIYALWSLKQKLEMVNRMIASGSTQQRIEALKERIDLYYSTHQYEALFKDMQRLAKDSLTSKDSQAIRFHLIKKISDFQLGTKEPVHTLFLLMGDKTTPGIYTSFIPAKPDSAARNDISKLDTFERGILEDEISSIFTLLTKKLAAEKPPVLPANIVFNGLYLSKESGILSNSAVKLLSTNQSAANVKHIRQYLKSSPTFVKVVALKALTNVLDRKFIADLNQLAKDPQQVVQIAAAISLANLNERSSLVKLVDLLDSEDELIRTRSFQVLQYLTKKHFDYIPAGKADVRKKTVEAWKAWLKKEGQNVKLNIPVKHFGVLIYNRILVCGHQRMIELDLKGRVTGFEVKNPSARNCQGLPSGHRLIADYSNRKIVEYDEDGKIVWSTARLEGRPTSVQRLSNGNTLVAIPTSRLILEIDKEKKIAKRISLADQPWQAKRLPNGNLLVVHTTRSKVVEYKLTGKNVEYKLNDKDIVWKIEGQKSPFSAQRLSNGNTLVVLQGNLRSTIEYNKNNEKVWEYTGLNRVIPYGAKRLPDGRTVIVFSDGIRMIDSSGKQQWHKSSTGFIGLDVY